MDPRTPSRRHRLLARVVPRLRRAADLRPPRLEHPGREGVRVEVLAFDQLDGATAYDAWRLRQDVFVVEQDCPYPDLDGRDREPATRHVLLREGDALLGYLRVLDDGTETRIGRVVLSRAGRGRGLADQMMVAALAETAGRPVVLDAQAPLARWYATHGFAVTGPEFLEDGIAHLPMRREGR